MSEQELLNKIGKLTSPENLLAAAKAYAAAQVKAERDRTAKLVRDIERCLSDKHLTQTTLEIAQEAIEYDTKVLTKGGHLCSAIELVHAALEFYKKESRG